MLEDINESVMAYYGFQSLASTSPDLAATTDQVAMPEELILLETLLSLHTNLREGGYLDQPWLLMQMLEAAARGKALFMQGTTLWDRPDTRAQG